MKRTTRQGIVAATLVATLCLLTLTRRSFAQAASGDGRPPLLELPELGPVPGSLDSRFDRSPGALVNSPFELPAGIIGGRRRGPKLSRSAGRVKGGGTATTFRSADPFAIASGTSLRHVSGLDADLSSDAGQDDDSSTLAVPAIPDSGAPSTNHNDDQGPADGLTIDAAIARMLAANLDLQSLKYEVPQADADILTANLRSNPILYLDTQFIPYGAYNNARPVGPTQYDINITYPLDLSRKRQARVAVACAAKRVLEAQYQDVVRRQIANVCRAFVDLQSAAIGVKGVEAALREQEQLILRKHRTTGKGTTSSDDRLEVELDKSRTGLNDALDNLNDAREAMGLLLNLGPEESGQLEPRGSLRNKVSALPPLDDLIRTALANRPDLAAARLGEGRAQAEVKLAQANRLDDVYFFYDPISYQDNRASKLPSGRSWDLGLAIPLPIYNRNQGNIARAKHNVSQTQNEHAALGRRVVSEVRQAYREYESSRAALRVIERTILPKARAARDKAHNEFVNGKLDADEYLNQLEDDAETAKLHRDAILRHRRSMIDINLAVALRLLP